MPHLIHHVKNHRAKQNDAKEETDFAQVQLLKLQLNKVWWKVNDAKFKNQYSDGGAVQSTTHSTAPAYASSAYIWLETTTQLEGSQRKWEVFVGGTEGEPARHNYLQKDVLGAANQDIGGGNAHITHHRARVMDHLWAHTPIRHPIHHITIMSRQSDGEGHID